MAITKDENEYFDEICNTIVGNYPNYEALMIETKFKKSGNRVLLLCISYREEDGTFMIRPVAQIIPHDMDDGFWNDLYENPFKENETIQ